MTQALVLFGSDSPAILPEAQQLIAQWTDFVRSKAVEGPLPVNAMGQSIADDIRDAASKAAAFLSEFERKAKADREPYYERFKQMKLHSDAAIMEFSAAVQDLKDTLKEFEAEKVRIAERINAQREAEARAQREAEAAKQRAAEEQRWREEQAERERLRLIEQAKAAEANAAKRAELEAKAAEERKRQEAAEAERERQRQAEQQRLAAIQAERFEAAKTEGVTNKTAFAYEFTNLIQAAIWIATNRPQWINRSRLEDAFFKRDITEFLNSGAEIPEIPGMRIFRALSSTVKKAKGRKVIDVNSKVEL